MTEIVSLADITKDIGIPTLIILAIFFGIYKLAPVIIKAQQESEVRQRDADAKQQEYFNQRQKQYDAQMEKFILVTQQGVQVAERANIVIEQVTEVMKRGTNVNEKIIDALDRNYNETKDVRRNMEEHDKRAERIQQEVIKIGERR
jgi:hypothetical protein